MKSVNRPVMDKGTIAVYPTKDGRGHKRIILRLPRIAGLRDNEAFLQYGTGTNFSALMLRVRHMSSLAGYTREGQPGFTREMAGHIPRVKVDHDDTVDVQLPSTHPLVVYLQRCLKQEYVGPTEVDCCTYPSNKSLGMYVPSPVAVREYVVAPELPLEAPVLVVRADPVEIKEVRLGDAPVEDFGALALTGPGPVPGPRPFEEVAEYIAMGVKLGRGYGASDAMIRAMIEEVLAR